ncbi:MAG: TIGR02281 family clan AA aspartic protease [Alphaproteobacteria bacterium]|nr:TIGR02281 family clan AA aspartic protease [Alphaproteobacteria bacterium]
MKLSQVFITLALAALVAASVSLLIAPRVQGPAQVDLNSATTPSQDEADLPDQSRRSARLALRPDGHYWARMLVNDKASVEFMVDTGASVVALTYRDAQKMGLNPGELDYEWEIRTAGGTTMGASVTIDSMRLNQVHIRNVEAMVLRANLDQSLLGMSFLRKLHSYEFRGERLIIRQ